MPAPRARTPAGARASKRSTRTPWGRTSTAWAVGPLHGLQELAGRQDATGPYQPVDLGQQRQERDAYTAPRMRRNTHAATGPERAPGHDVESGESTTPAVYRTDVSD